MKKLFIYLSLAFFSISSCFSQGKELKAANNSYDNYAYSNAIKEYEGLINQGYADAEVFMKTANSCFFIADYANGAKYYKQLFQVENEPKPECYYRYAHCLKSIGDYKGADEIMDRFTKIEPNDSRSIAFEKNRNYLEEIKSNTDSYTVKTMALNSVHSDYGAKFYDDKLYFSSSRPNDKIAKKTSDWNGETYSSIFVSNVSQGGGHSVPSVFSLTSENGDYYESTPVFTNDGNTMYYTKNDSKTSEVDAEGRKKKVLKIYSAHLVKGVWKNEKEVSFVSNKYNVAHPALSVDGKTMYFASDMPGGFGETDIYKTTINSDGTFSTPENLGSSINTEGNESFPFESNDGYLYFSSTGHPGLGGYDVFISKIEGAKYGTSTNLGAPLNSGQDDFAFSINSVSKKGYFSSNRTSGRGHDDIYECVELRKPGASVLVDGILRDSQTGLPIAAGAASLYDESGALSQTTTTDENGNFTFKAPSGQQVKLVFEKNGYETQDYTVFTDTAPKNYTLTPIAPKKGDDLAANLNIGTLYFDLNKSNINKKAAAELAKVLQLMDQYPNMKINLNAHTDSRGDDKYNLALSNRRANSSRSWLIERGIKANRIEAKGFGETKILNKCTNNVPCQEEEHHLNRRTEFLVKEL